jgi:type IV pilus assembly protein PilX
MNEYALGRGEGGAVLIVTLMFLVILTLLGVTAMTSATMEERMAGNTRDAAVALQAAESALRDARRDISNIPVKGKVRDGIPIHSSDFGIQVGGVKVPESCNPSTDPDFRGLCVPANYPAGTPYDTLVGSIMPAFPAAHSLRAEPSIKYGQMTGADDIGGEGTPVPATEPRYVIENFCLLKDGESMGVTWCNFFRITARGYGRNPSTQITLQETFVSL